MHDRLRSRSENHTQLQKKVKNLFQRNHISEEFSLLPLIRVYIDLLFSMERQIFMWLRCWSRSNKIFVHMGTLTLSLWKLAIGMYIPNIYVGM